MMKSLNYIYKKNNLEVRHLIFEYMRVYEFIDKFRFYDFFELHSTSYAVFVCPYFQLARHIDTLYKPSLYNTKGWATHYKFTAEAEAVF